MSGFTVAELLVVVGIITILVSLAILIYRGVMERSQRAADAANRRVGLSLLSAEFCRGAPSGTVWYLENGGLSSDPERGYKSQTDGVNEDNSEYEKGALLCLWIEENGVVHGVFRPRSAGVSAADGAGKAADGNFDDDGVEEEEE